MKREWLREIGIDEEIVGRVMAEHGKDIERLKGELTQAKTEAEGLRQGVETARFEMALEHALRAAGAVDGALVRVKLEPDRLRLRGDGTIEGIDEQLDAIGSQFPMLFHPKQAAVIEGVRPADTAVRGATMTRADFEGLSYKERLRLFYEDREGYTQLTMDN